MNDIDYTSLILGSISTVLVALDNEGTVIVWNDAAATLFGVPSDQALGQPFGELSLTFEESGVQDRIWQTHLAHEPVAFEDLRFLRADAKVRILGMKTTPLVDPDTGDRGLLVQAADITDRRHQEQTGLQSQKLEAIGQLAAGIAHEINTPIQYVGDSMAFARESFEDLTGLLKTVGELSKLVKDPPEFTDKLEEAEEDADLEFINENLPPAFDRMADGLGRIATIVGAIKEFSHPSAGTMVPADLNAAIQNTLIVAQSVYKGVAVVETDLGADLPNVTCEVDQINQVLLNLVVNASHAMADRHADSGEMGCLTLRSAVRGGAVELAIGDTGGGIPKSVREHIFDPFFTTKEVGRGPGQGLAIAHNIVVEEHGGQLEFDTVEGEGTTFFVRLLIEGPQAG